MSSKFIVCAISESAGLSKSLTGPCKSAGLVLTSQPNVVDFLESLDEDKPVACVVAPLDGGIDLLKELADSHCVVPVVLVSGPGNHLPAAVLAMKAGAFDVVEKADGAAESAKRATTFFARSQKLLAEKAVAAERIDSLTRRESQVLTLMVEGIPNREIAEHLGISTKTLDIHRANLMDKMEARTTADMCRAHLLHVTIPAHLPLVAKSVSSER
jgi:two-component system response regulator FixJ